MLRYEVKGNNMIYVNLQNGYTAIGIAKWDREQKCYLVDIMLKDDTIDLWDLCQKAENVPFTDSKRDTINRDMAAYITGRLTEGFFQYYIDRYEYEQRCFDRGHEMFEAERLGRDTEENRQ